MYTCVLHPHVVLNETKNHVAYYNHVNVDHSLTSIAFFSRSFNMEAYAADRYPHFIFVKCCAAFNIWIFSAQNRFLHQRKSISSSSSAGKIAAYLFLLHFLTLFFVSFAVNRVNSMRWWTREQTIVSTKGHSNHRRRRSITMEHVFFTSMLFCIRFRSDSHILKTTHRSHFGCQRATSSQQQSVAFGL